MTAAETLTPAYMLEEAGRLLDTPTRETVSGWPRAVAVLARMALESALAGCWATRPGDLQRLDMRAQINCARVYLGRELAGEISIAWHGLSRATHHHPYELDPTSEELRSLLALTARAIVRLQEPRDTARTGRP